MKSRPAFDIASIIKKAQAVLEREDISLALSNIAKDYYNRSLIKKENLEFWLKEREALEERAEASDLVLTAYYLELAGVKLVSYDIHVQDAYQILSYAGRLFEYIGKYLDLPSTYRMNILKHAAICYDSCGNPANCIVMANEVIEILMSEARPLEIVPRFFHYVELLILYLLSRRFHEIPQLYNMAISEKEKIQEVIKAYEKNEEQSTGLIKFLGYLEISTAISYFYQFVTEGKSHFFEKCMDALSRGVNIFLNYGDSENFGISSLLLIVVQQIHKRSIWVTLAKYMEKSHDYLRLLVSSQTPIIELWESQLQAIENGLLSENVKRFVVSMPTSAGKTLIAEFAIVNSLIRTPSSTCIYVAPSRALALQVERDLRNRIPKLGFKVSFLVGSYDHPEIVRLKLENCNVLITTPEKLSLLLKEKHSITTKCGLFVFDEAQTIQTGENRGIHLEMLVIRITHLLQDSRILFLSVVMNNPNEIADWMGNDKSKYISVEWHPTRILQAILRDGWVDYYDEMKGLKLRVSESIGKSLSDQAVILTKIYQPLGPVLIFCNKKATAEDIVKNFTMRGYSLHRQTKQKRD